MKNIILILLPFLLFHCSKEEPDLSIQTSINKKTDIHTNRTTSIQIDTFRGKQKIHEHLKQDMDRDGIFDVISNTFYVDSEPIFSYHIINDQRNYRFYSQPNVRINTSDSNHDGIFDTVLILDKENALIEYFDVNAKYEYVPLEPEDLKHARETYPSNLKKFLDNIFEPKKGN